MEKRIEYLENLLFDEWKRNRNYQFFAKDGVVNPEQWSKAKYNIVYVLKEVNNPDRDFDLRSFLLDGGSPTYWKTWNNIARWTKGILYGGDYPKEVSGNDKIELLSNICAINLKKIGGGARADSKTIRTFAKKDAEYIKQQLLLYKPDVVICCGRGDGMNADLLHDIVFEEDSKWESPINTFNYYYSNKMNSDKKVPVLSVYHPQKRASHENYKEWYNAIIETCNETIDIK